MPDWWYPFHSYQVQLTKLFFFLFYLNGQPLQHTPFLSYSFVRSVISSQILIWRLNVHFKGASCDLSHFKALWSDVTTLFILSFPRTRKSWASNAQLQYRTPQCNVTGSNSSGRIFVETGEATASLIGAKAFVTPVHTDIVPRHAFYLLLFPPTHAFILIIFTIYSRNAFLNDDVWASGDIRK